MKISGTMQRIPEQDMRAVEGLNAFYIFPAGTKKSLMNIFATHPPMDKRIAALQRLEAQLQGTA
jgi:heat shock protein HtpX